MPQPLNTDVEDTRVKLGDIISNIGDLPTLPSVVTKITKMTSNPQTNAADVGKLIGNDPALSAKILKLVNSSYYGFPRKINSITKAIVLLGFNKVKNMALSASVVDLFKNTGKAMKFDFYRFWEHSVATGIAAEVTAKHLCPQAADDAFVGGLLHDIGKVVVINYLDNASDIIAHAETKKVTFQEATTAVLGFDHAAIGSLLAEHWNFPELMVNSIRYWPIPEKTRQYREVIGCVHLGNVMVSALGIPGPGDHAMPIVSPGVWQELNITEETLEKLCDETLRGFSNASAFLDLAK